MECHGYVMMTTPLKTTFLCVDSSPDTLKEAQQIKVFNFISRWRIHAATLN